MMVVGSFFQNNIWAKSKNLEIGGTIQTMYDSNIFFSESSRESDWVTLVGPTLNYLSNGANETILTVNAKPTYLFYGSHDDLSQLTFNVSESLRREINKNWSFSLANSNIKDSTSYLTDDAVGATGRFDYTFFSVQPSLVYNSKNGFVGTLQYGHDWINFKDSNIPDSDGNQVTFGSEKELSNFVAALADLSFVERSFTNDVNVTVWLVDGGLRYEPDRKTTHTLKGGFELIDQGVDSGTANEFYFLYSLSYKLTRKTSVNFATQKQSSIIDSLNNAVDIRQTSASLTYQLNPKDRLQSTISYVEAAYDSLDSEDSIWKTEWTLEHTLNKNTTIRFGYSFEDKESELASGYARHLAYLNLQVIF